MADDAEILSARFEGDVANLRQASAEAKKLTADWEKTAERHLGAASKSFKSFGVLSGSVFRGLGAGLAAVFTVDQISKLADSAARIEDIAQAVGLTTTRYQELANAARVAGVAQESFDSATTRFAQSMGDLRRNTGSFYTFLQSSLPTVLEQLQATRSQSEAFDVAAEAVRRLETAESRAVFIKQAFGRGANGLAVALKDGVSGLDQAAKSAGRYAVVSEDAIKNTNRLTDAFDEMGIRARASLQELIGKLAGPLATALDETTVRIDKLNKTRGLGGQPFIGGLAERVDAIQRMQQPEDWPATTRNGDDEPLSFAKKTDSKALEQIQKLRTQLASARGEMFQQITEEEGASLAAITRLHEQTLVTEGDFVEARALIAATADAKRVDARKATDEQLAQLRISALEADGETFAALRAQYDLDEQSYKEMLDRKLISQEQYQAALANLAKTEGQKIQEAMAAAYSRAGDVVSSNMSKITSVVADESKAQFELTRAAAIATAALKAQEAAISSYAAGAAIGGPPVGAAFGVMSAVATAAQMVSLLGIRLGGGGSLPTTGGGGGSVPSVPAGGGSSDSSGGGDAAAQRPLRTINVNLVGHIFDRETVRDMIEGLNDAIADGARLYVSP